jgi:hypothetical protein
MGKPVRVGFVGCPSEPSFEAVRKRFACIEWVDLDNQHKQSARHSAELLPQNVCAIIKRIVDNSLSLDLQAILFDQGFGKCDNARAVAALLEDRLDIPVLRTRNENREGRGTPLCDSNLPLLAKAEKILDGLTDTTPPPDLDPVDPPAALWGVPASDFDLYKLFPDGTRLIGWFRCLENRTPADESLELSVDPEVPTVFFSQAFCHKNILAKNLAAQYNGLYVDMDGTLTSSIRAKVETFLRFNVEDKK